MGAILVCGIDLFLTVTTRFDAFKELDDCVNIPGKKSTVKRYRKSFSFKYNIFGFFLY